MEAARLEAGAHMSGAQIKLKIAIEYETEEAEVCKTSELCTQDSYHLPNMVYCPLRRISSTVPLEFK